MDERDSLLRPPAFRSINYDYGNIATLPVNSATEVDVVETSTDVSHSREYKYCNCKLALAIFSCVIGSSFQYGYHTGVVNLPEQVLQDFFNKTEWERSGTSLSNMLPFLWGLAVSIYCVGGIIGGLTATIFTKCIGRKGTLMCNNVLMFVAVGLLSFSKLARSYEMIIIGRFIIGVNAGIGMSTAPLYLAEISPILLRGLAGTINQLGVTFGILASQVIGLKYSFGTATLWPLVFGISALPGLIQLLLLFWCPESPAYLMLNKNEEDEAEQALIWLRNTHDIGDELEELRKEKDHLPKERVLFKQLLIQPELRAPLIIAIMMQLSQQFSGINAVIYYSTSIFESAGLSEENAQFASIGVGIPMIIMTVISAVTVDKAGRRVLHLTGLGGMFVFSIILTLSLQFQPKANWLSYIAIVGICMYLIFFGIGPAPLMQKRYLSIYLNDDSSRMEHKLQQNGSIPWLFSAELFLQGPRDMAVSVATAFNWLANGSVGLVYPQLQKSLSNLSFLPFSATILFFWIFTFLKVPETKGRSIEEIAAEFVPKSTKKSPVYHSLQSDFK